MEGVEIKELQVYEDHRGWLAEILREDENDFRPSMSYLSMTKPGLVRGPHEHEEQTDYFCFIGRFRLYLWDNRKTSETFMEKKVFDISETPTIAIVPPGVVHAYENIDNKNGIVINLPDRLFMGHGKTESVDETRYENDPSSPFRIEE